MAKRFYLADKKAEEGFERTKNLNVVFIGRTGSGKSTCANTLIGQQVFKTSKQDKGVTKNVMVHQFQIEKCNVR